MNNFIKNELESHQKLVELVVREMQDSINDACKMALDVINAGNKLSSVVMEEVLLILI